MKIKKNVIEHICENVAGSLSETGGILGSGDGEIVSEVIMDNLRTEYCRCSYEPNVRFFNRCIDKWQKEKKYFIGIFHTHFFNIKTLSPADVKYINTIINAMPDEVDQLYFPIFTIPDNELICYKASRSNNEVNIEKEMLEIV